jgi:hypothetical protein
MELKDGLQESLPEPFKQLNPLHGVESIIYL